MVAAEQLSNEGDPRPWRVTSREYWRMVDAGILEGRRVQLIRGVIVEMSPMKEPHAVVITNLNRLLVKALPETWSVRVQEPLDVGADSVPEPDFAVMTSEQEVARQPDAPDTAPFVCEVADSSLIFDRVEKLPLYAGAGVAEYVIANVKQRELEVYARPLKTATYQQKSVHRAGGAFTSSVLPGVVLRVEDVFARLPSA